jgi:predicted nucleotide-binding protein
MRRKSGRVIVLRNGQVDIPSDLKGVVYIDVSRGIKTAADEIQLEDFLQR